jgi:hypothetical protein
MELAITFEGQIAPGFKRKMLTLKIYLKASGIS